ncbi:MAG: TlpA family protein disulfide reductase [Desulfobacteria bacterium]|nr:TlpA disulfide reductase family protein [Deltaproteobacteria bacterium]HQT96356.1 TlpA disulfide reductase family protein [Thermodesulfobacteriota bacterium]
MRFTRRRFRVPVFLLFLLPPVLAPTRAMGDQQKLRPLLHAGEKAPGFSLKDIDGDTIAFRPGHGKPALVVFWSVFCPMCREMMPGIERFAARHGKTVRVIAVNLDGKRFTNAVRAWSKEAHPRFRVGLDELRGDYFVASDPYGVEKTPTVVLIDGNGLVRGAWAAEGVREFGKNADALAGGLRKGKHPGQ